MSASNTFVERFKEISDNETQAAIAKRLNSSQPTISKMLNGTPPSESTLIAISKSYGVSIDWLLGISSVKEPAYSKSNDTYSYFEIIKLFDYLLASDFITITLDSDDLYLDGVGDETLKELLEQRIHLNSLDETTRKAWLNQIKTHYSNCYPKKDELPF